MKHTDRVEASRGLLATAELLVAVDASIVVHCGTVIVIYCA